MTTLTGLTETSSLTDDDLLYVVINALTTPANRKLAVSTVKTTALSWFESQTVSTISYTTVASDNGKVIVMNSGSAVTLTIHQTAPAGFSVAVLQKGAGQVTIAAGGTGAVRNRYSFNKTSGQYAMASVYVESNTGSAPQVYLGGEVAS